MAKKDNQTKASGPGKATSQGKKAGARRSKQKTAKQRLQERAKAAGVQGWEKMTERQLRNELQRIQNEGKDVPDLREGNGGRETASKDPIIIEIKEQHLMEEVTVTVHNTKTGEFRSEKKNRFRALLDMLAHEGLTQKNVAATREYFDRTLGKAKQEVLHSGEIKTDEQRLPTPAEKAAAAAYRAALAAEQGHNG